MKIIFDPAKDRANVAKHGVSLARAADMDMTAVLEGACRNYGERRYRAFGFIDGVAHCLAFTVRADDIRAISLRRAHAKEIKRHAP